VNSVAACAGTSSAEDYSSGGRIRPGSFGASHLGFQVTSKPYAIWVVTPQAKVSSVSPVAGLMVAMGME